MGKIHDVYKFLYTFHCKYDKCIRIREKQYKKQTLDYRSNTSVCGLLVLYLFLNIKDDEQQLSNTQ